MKGIQVYRTMVPGRMTWPCRLRWLALGILRWNGLIGVGVSSCLLNTWVHIVGKDELQSKHRWIARPEAVEAIGRRVKCECQVARPKLCGIEKWQGPNGARNEHSKQNLLGGGILRTDIEHYVQKANQGRVSLCDGLLQYNSVPTHFSLRILKLFESHWPNWDLWPIAWSLSSRRRTRWSNNECETWVEASRVEGTGIQ